MIFLLLLQIIDTNHVVNLNFSIQNYCINCAGDYLQAVLSNMELDVFISNLIVAEGEMAAGEEPEGVTAMTLLNSLRTQEFGAKYRHLDMAESILLALWHQDCTKPMIEGDTLIRFENLVRLSERMKGYSIDRGILLQTEELEQ